MRKGLILIIASISFMSCELEMLCTKEIYRNGFLIERTQRISNEGFCDCQESLEFIQGNTWQVVCY